MFRYPICRGIFFYEDYHTDFKVFCPVTVGLKSTFVQTFSVVQSLWGKMIVIDSDGK